MRNEQVIVAAEEVLRAIKDSGGDAEVRTSTLAFLLLVPTTDPRRGNLDGLVASANFQLVSPRSLRGALADWPAVLRDLQEEEVAARTFVQETLIPYLATAIDLPDVYDWRLATTPSHRGTTDDAGGVNLAEDPLIRVPRDGQLANLIASRRYFSQLVISNALDVQEELDAILGGLREAVGH